MNKRRIFFLLICLLFLNVVNAQFRNGRRPANSSNVNNALTTPNNTTGVQQSAGNTQQNLSGAVKQDTVYVPFDSTRNKPFNPPKKRAQHNSISVLKSEAKDLRHIDNSLDTLPYPELREEDAMYSTLVWKQIDAREKINRSFIYDAVNQNGDQRFMAVLMKILHQKYDTGTNKGLPILTAYSADEGDDDIFTTPITLEKVDSFFVGARDTTYQDHPSIQNRIVGTIQSKGGIKSDNVVSFILKEQYVFDKKYSQIFRRIIGIAPVAIVPQKAIKQGNLKSLLNPRLDSFLKAPPQPKVLFWVYYPELRPYLNDKFSYNPRNQQQSISWSNLLDLGYFNATIIKTTLDNPENKSLADLFGDDPKKRLEYAEKMRQKIFDQEQDRWVY